MSKPVQKRVLRLNDRQADWVKSEILLWERRDPGVYQRVSRISEYGTWVHHGLINLKVI